MLRTTVRWVVVCVALVAAGTARADQPVASEADVKAAFLFNFLKYVEWPGGEPDSYCIAVLGGSAVLAPLEQIAASRQVRGRPLRVARARHVSGIPQGCHVLFIPAALSRQVEETLTAVAGRSILTVSEGPGLAAHGVALSFVGIGDHIGFEVNPRAIERAGLLASSRLLSLAVVVGGGPR
jgi:YfiR/HmsC-like